MPGNLALTLDQDKGSGISNDLLCEVYYLKLPWQHLKLACLWGVYTWHNQLVLFDHMARVAWKTLLECFENSPEAKFHCINFGWFNPLAKHILVQIRKTLGNRAWKRLGPWRLPAHSFSYCPIFFALLKYGLWSSWVLCLSITVIFAVGNTSIDVH